MILLVSLLPSVKSEGKRWFFIHIFIPPLTDVANLASTGEPLTSQGTVIKIPHTSFKLGARSYCSIERGSIPGFFKISMVMGWFKERTPLKLHDHCYASVCPAFFITAWHHILSLYLSGILCVWMGWELGTEMDDYILCMHLSPLEWCAFPYMSQIMVTLNLLCPERLGRFSLFGVRFICFVVFWCLHPQFFMLH